MRKTLFRQDAVEYSRQKLLGQALLAGPFSLRFLTAAICGLAAGVIAFAWWGEYTPKIHVRGYLTTSAVLPTGSRLEAQLLVPGRAIEFIDVGHRVALHLQPLPYQLFGSPKGRVTEVGRTPVTSSDSVSPATTPEGAYRVTVALDSDVLHARNRDYTLQPGMLLDADIWLERRRIIDWVFDPHATAVRAART